MYTDIQSQLSPEENHWLRVLEDSQKSGTTQKAFCKKAGVDYKEFRKWRITIYKKMGRYKHSSERRQKSCSRLLKLIPVKLKKASPMEKHHHANIRIEIGNVKIYVQDNFDPLTLKSVIEAVN